MGSEAHAASKQATSTQSLKPVTSTKAPSPARHQPSSPSPPQRVATTPAKPKEEVTGKKT